MNIKAIPLEKFFKNKETIYKNIMIIAKRARQIINQRYEKMAAYNDIEDSDELIDIEEEELNQEKSISIAMDELLNNELEYRNLEQENDEKSDI